MRKHLILFLSLLLTASLLRATPVSRTQAHKVAETFLRSHGLHTSQLSDVSQQTPYHGFFTFTLEGGGFILVAADDATQPVLAYSVQSTFPTEPIPAHVHFWLDQYERLVAANSTQGRPRHADWDLLQSGVMPPETYTAVNPLMTTTWNQSPYYNNLCPWDDTYDARTVTGCVATATAQIMKYWNYPTTGYDSHSYTSNYGVLSANFGETTYQWSQMPNALNSSSTSTQVNAVATLMYHIGVADEMSYGPSATGGSGAQNYAYWGAYNNSSSQNSLIRYFKYAPDMQAVDRSAHGTSEFCSILRADLNLGQPILYSGRDTSGGHSFVFDGYDASGLFHVNWGWGGAYDGYYLVGDLHPGTGGIGSNSTHTFNLNNVALTNIYPNTNWGNSTTVSVTASSGGTATGSGTYSFGNTVYLSATANSGNRFAGWNGSGGFANRSFMATGGSYNFQASFESILQNDTISYCGNSRNISGYGNSSGYLTIWGICIPGGLANNRQLNAVDLYVREAGTYTLKIYANNTTFLVYSDTVTFTSTGWQSFPLSSPLTIAPNQPIYISFEASVPYAAAISTDCGNSDAMLWGSDLTPIYQPYTLMIRAILASTSQGGGNEDDVQCAWADNVGDEDFGYYWTQDHNNGIYSLAEKFTNSDSLRLDSISFMPYIVSGSSTSTFTVAIHSANSSGAPGTQLHSQTVTYSSLSTMTWNSIALSSLVEVTGDYFVVLNLNSTPTTDTIALLSTDELSHTGTAWAKYNGLWYNFGPLYTNFTNGVSLLVKAHGCPSNTSVSHTLSVLSNQEQWGTVSGSGFYQHSANATLTATPTSGYQFITWQDGVSTNPRTVTVNQDAIYIATFGTPSTLDTFYIDHYIHDTLFVEHYIHDTLFVDHYIHDTTFVQVIIHDTTLIDHYIHDTTFVDHYIYDTIFADHYIHDTTFVDHYIYDTVTLEPTLHSITVLAANPSQGIGAGNGHFAEGTQVELAAIPLEGFRFDRWEDGPSSNPRTITVSGPATYKALFTASTQCIGSMEALGISVETQAGIITVHGAQGERIRLLDVLGRTLASENHAAFSQSFRVASTGAYFVQVGNLPARKVVVLALD